MKKNVLIALLCMVWAAALAQKSAQTDKVYEREQVEVPAEFSGGTDGLMKYMMQSIKYPAEARSKELSGRVVVRFVVEKDGLITEVEAIKSVHPILDKAAIGIIRLMPKWKPAQIGGKPVRSHEILPIFYRYR